MAGEREVCYFEDKLLVAKNINVDVEELLEQIIEGIPSQSLRNQARIICFTEPMQILRAFSGVRLWKQKKESNASLTMSSYNSDSKEMRCHNCNARGHLA